MFSSLSIRLFYITSQSLEPKPFFLVPRAQTSTTEHSFCGLKFCNFLANKKKDTKYIHMYFEKKSFFTFLRPITLYYTAHCSVMKPNILPSLASFEVFIIKSSPFIACVTCFIFRKIFFINAKKFISNKIFGSKKFS